LYFVLPCDGEINFIATLGLCYSVLVATYSVSALFWTTPYRAKQPKPERADGTSASF